MRPTSPLFRVALVLQAASFSACQSVPVSSSPPMRPAAGPPTDGAPSTRLTEAAFKSVLAANAEELVRRLRPEFIRARMIPRDLSGIPVQPGVLIDGVYSGGPDALRLVPVEVVVEIQYLDAFRAQELGPRCDCRAGAIAVTTRRK